MDLKRIITDAHMAGQHNQGVDASWSEAYAYYTEFMKNKKVGNVAKPNACAQLAEVIDDWMRDLETEDIYILPKLLIKMKEFRVKHFG